MKDEEERRRTKKPEGRKTKEGRKKKGKRMKEEGRRRKEKERKGKERKGKERKGKEGRKRKEKGRKGQERKGLLLIICVQVGEPHKYKPVNFEFLFQDPYFYFYFAIIRVQVGEPHKYKPINFISVRKNVVGFKGVISRRMSQRVFDGSFLSPLA